jgi:hypothetical protein
LPDGEFEVVHGFAILDLRFAICDLAAEHRSRFKTKGGSMTEAEMKQRTKQFALRIIKLISALPRTTEGRAIAAQLVRSGTSVGANYRVGPPRRKARPHCKSALRIQCNNRRSYRITWHGLFSGHSVPEYYLTDPEGS